MKLLPCIAVALLLLVGPAHAEDACKAFKWDVTHEHALFVREGRMAAAGKDAAAAPTLDVDKLYLMTLLPQKQVKFAAPPSKKTPAKGAFAGVAHFQVMRPGQYRVSLDAPFWIDLVANGKPLTPIDFSSAHGCDMPRKVVVFDVPAAQSLTLQLGGSTEDKVHLTLTPVAAPKK
ncbi:MAG: hypothetical protein ABI843_00865 [Dokdonella sp.]